MNEKPEALRWAAILEHQANHDGATDYKHKAAAELRHLHAENEQLRELVRHILGDRITPEAYLLFGKAWVDEAHAALRREPGDG